MSFIGPKLFVQLTGACVSASQKRKKNHSFDNRSIILVGDLGQPPPVMDKPLYAGATLGNRLWIEFRTVIILQTLFRQTGTDGTQQ